MSAISICSNVECFSGLDAPLAPGERSSSAASAARASSIHPTSPAASWTNGLWPTSYLSFDERFDAEKPRCCCVDTTACTFLASSSR